MMKVNESNVRNLSSLQKENHVLFIVLLIEQKSRKIIEKLINSGFSTVLTSGGKSNVEEGKEMLQN